MRFVQGFLRQVVAGFAVLLALTVILGIAYPAVVWGISRIGTDSAEG
ncbi:MAG: K+-transporting ATPase subunit C, partial [Rhodococcus sp.]|nr:K+-transporting ATPase subunit C [Rhodococcus sp. (in: high G+C Gram-positive bacteria)]